MVGVCWKFAGSCKHPMRDCTRCLCQHGDLIPVSMRRKATFRSEKDKDRRTKIKRQRLSVFFIVETAILTCFLLERCNVLSVRGRPGGKGPVLAIALLTRVRLVIEELCNLGSGMSY